MSSVLIMAKKHGKSKTAIPIFKSDISCFKVKTRSNVVFISLLFPFLFSSVFSLPLSILQLFSAYLASSPTMVRDWTLETNVKGENADILVTGHFSFLKKQVQYA